MFLESTAWAEEIGSQASQGAVSIEIPNFLSLLQALFPRVPFFQFLVQWQNVVFALLAASVLAWIGWLAARKSALIPGGLQNAVEMVVEVVDDFVCGILGPAGHRFTPFIGTLFVYILFMNLLGLVPLMKSPTSAFTTTFPLAVAVFFYVQYTGIRSLGLIGYLDHLAGEPRNVVGFLLAPLMIFIHLVGELAKPLSLSLRLFGNVWGEDMLIAVFLGLGAAVLCFLPIPVGIPFQFPFIFLAILTGLIQALVFALLSTTYILLMLPRHEEHETT